MKRWKIVYDTYCAATEKIYAAVQPYLPYVPVCDTKRDEAYNCVLTSLDPKTDGYEITVSKAEGESQQITITAKDEIDLLYAASDFKNVCLPSITAATGERVVDFYEHKPLCEPMRPYHLAAAPKIKRRGLWTWGHTIYDYKKYIDRMVSLKLNVLIIWNDYVPVNIEDVIACAHKNGIEIYLGFAWGWDTNCAENDISDTRPLTKKVVDTYRREYAALSCDGIYFQSFTELRQPDINGVPIADAVISFVNRTYEELLTIRPDLKLLFGIHGTSVKHRADAFRDVDPRITLVWEDLGAFPFHYSPVYLEDTAETLRLAEKLQQLPQPFGAVLKGIYHLDWSSFEHQEGPYLLGVADEETQKKAAEQRRDLHRNLQADWIKYAPFAQKMIRSFGEDSLITVLAEDGVLEQGITYPLAVYSQMLWNSDRPTEEILYEAALMPDVRFY